MNLEDARTIALSEMARFRLDGWKFAFDSAVKRAGQCRYRDRTVALSRHFVALNGEDQVRETVLHEIAHALAGPSAGHGPLWKATAIAVGARPVRCYDPSEVVTLRGRWCAVCPGCSRLFFSHKVVRRERWCMECGCKDGQLVYRLLNDLQLSIALAARPSTPEERQAVAAALEAL